MTADELIANFETLAEAPDGVARLRELVLELAVRGKLVPQDPTDPPASSLLGRRTVPAPNETALPAGWACSSLALLGDIMGGGTPSKSSANLWQGTLPWVSPKDMKTDVIADAQDHISEAAVAESSVRLIPTGALLMVVRGMILAHSFPTALTSIVVTINQDMKALVPFRDDIARYLRLLTRGEKRAFLALVERSTHGTCKLPSQALLSMPLRIPPLPEQHRIVAKVDELMTLLDRLNAARRARETARTASRDSALQALRDATTPDQVQAAWTRVARHLDHLITDPADIEPLRQTILELAIRGHLVPQDPNEEPASLLLERIAEARGQRGATAAKIGDAQWVVSGEDTPVAPEGWAWSRMSETFLVQGGIQKSGKRRPVKNVCPYLRVANVQRGRLDLSEIEHFELFDGELERARLEPGDLLVVEGNGSESEIGRCARWIGDIDPCVHQNHLIRCRPLVHGLEHFVLRFLNSPAGVSRMKALAVTTSGLYNLSVGKIKSIAVPIPPLPEQRRIVAKVEELLGVLERLEERLHAIRDAQGGFAAAAVKVHLNASANARGIAGQCAGMVAAP